MHDVGNLMMNVIRNTLVNPIARVKNCSIFFAAEIIQLLTEHILAISAYAPRLFSSHSSAADANIVQVISACVETETCRERFIHTELHIVM